MGATLPTLPPTLSTTLPLAAPRLLQLMMVLQLLLVWPARVLLWRR